MEHTFDSVHLREFIAKAQPGHWPTTPLGPWIDSIGLAPTKIQLSVPKVDRGFLKKAAGADSSTVSDRDLLWAILSWGRMRRNAARVLKEREDHWTAVVGRLRRDGMTRTECYEICHATMREFNPAGIGPAYFTKLIFFANPRHDGYIMDQWTSRSINLLVEGPAVVRMRTQDHVDPRNDKGHYEAFCQAVEALSDKLETRDHEHTEQCLFSRGGRRPDPWREYLKKNGG